MNFETSSEGKKGFSRNSLQLKSLGLRLIFAFAVAFLISQLNLEYIESWFFDLRIRARISQKNTENIQLIYITPATIQKLKGMPDSEYHNVILKKLISSGAKAIVYDIPINETQGALQDKKAWATTIANNLQVYVASKETTLKGEEKNLYLSFPFENLKATPAPKTADTLNFAKDSVTRRMILTYQDLPILQLQLARLYNPELVDPKSVRGHFLFYNTMQTYIDYLRPKSFKSFSIEDLGSNKIDFSQFKNKILIIGTDLNLNEAEYIRTPYSSSPTAMTRIEMLAQSIDTLIRNSSPLKLPLYINWILLGLISAITIQIVLSMKPAQGLLTILGILAGFTFFCFGLSSFFGIWVTMAHPLLAGFLCYYFFIPYRLIIENRRSWEYYQKNKILSQVEELKTNFISMMSHDLKTPLARIQGMTDVILADSNSVSSQQREAIDTIKFSAEDLLKFVNAILNYGRVESQGFQLNLQSKDINNLLTEVVRKHEFLAKIKYIQIIMELEPIFPVPVDPDLIKQVFSNLVENAIKYSNDHTRILICSEEQDGRVMIQIIDQGPGIPTDELPHIFMKFFRSKNAKSSPIKGSGLGLYLAKYFTELHGGKIVVESICGNGSTFTVELPMDQGGLNA
jgi:hypothetical protein